MLLGVGQYGFQFEFLLPANLPGSFDGDHGEVHYVVGAVIKRPSTTEDHSVMVSIKVRVVLHFNHTELCTHAHHPDFSLEPQMVIIYLHPLSIINLRFECVNFLLFYTIALLNLW